MNSSGTRRGTRPRGRSVLAVGVAVVSVLLLTAAPASAADDIPVTIVFAGDADQTIEYGTPWNVSVETTANGCTGCTGRLTFLLDGDTFSEMTALSGNQDGTPAQYSTGGYGSGNGFNLLDVGEHEVSATFSGLGGSKPSPFTGSTTESATITVDPAPLTVDLRAETDPLHAVNAIVTARLGGPILDFLVPPQYQDESSGPVLPAGTWDVSFVDAAGATAFSQQIPAAEGGFPYLALYWKDVPAGTTFTGSATFAPSGETAGNFAVTGATAASFTSPGSAVAAPTDPAAEDAGSTPDASATRADGVPLWVVAVAGLLALLSVVAIAIVLLVARRRRSGGGGDTTHDDDQNSSPSPLDEVAPPAQEDAHV